MRITSSDAAGDVHYHKPSNSPTRHAFQLLMAPPPGTARTMSVQLSTRTYGDAREIVNVETSRGAQLDRHAVTDGWETFTYEIDIGTYRTDTGPAMQSLRVFLGETYVSAFYFYFLGGMLPPSCGPDNVPTLSYGSANSSDGTADRVYTYSSDLTSETVGCMF